MLHKDDDLKDAKAKISQHVALPVNIRKVDTLMLGENCIQKDDSLVNKPRKKKKDPSKIINQGIKWLRGNAYAEKDLRSVADALQEYFNALKKMIPLQNPSELSLVYASELIESHEWSDSQEDKHFVLGVINKYSGTESKSELVKKCCLARQFIYKHMAKQTNVVAHVVDEIHRLTALEFVLIGYQQPDTDNCAVRLPHAGTNLAITSVVPLESQLESKNFLDDMKNISPECQQSFGSLQPHSKRYFFAAMIKHLDEVCRVRGLGRRPFFLMTKQVETQMVVPPKIEYIATEIIKVICDNKHVKNYCMVPNMNLETLVKKDVKTWTNLFKTKNGEHFFL